MKIKIITNKINDTSYEYRGVDNETNTQLFKKTIHDAHIGIVEFIATIHALMYLKKNKIDGVVLISNEYIKQSIETKSYKHQTKNNDTNMIIGQCRYWLIEQKHELKIEIIKKNENENTNK